MGGHFLNLVLYAAVVGALFSVFMRERNRDRLRFGLLLAMSMIGAAVAVGWLMYLAG